MKNSVDDVMSNIFLLNNKTNDIHILNSTFIDFYYNMKPNLQNRINISIMWGNVLRKWHENMKKI